MIARRLPYAGTRATPDTPAIPRSHPEWLLPY
jgi:hypothetical protein